VERKKEGASFITDEGNLILDCHIAGIADASGLGQLIRAQPGVVEHGLFLSLATEAIVAGKRGIISLNG
jgi:ribose 5-phosphate isomerase A